MRDIIINRITTLDKDNNGDFDITIAGGKYNNAAKYHGNFSTNFLLKMAIANKITIK